MTLNNHRKCDKCGAIFDTSPFANMCGNGELAYSRITLYGDEYDLCPKCTSEIHNIVTKKEFKNIIRKKSCQKN